MSERGSGAPQARDFLRMSFRALFLLSLWNNRTLQGPGFVWALCSKDDAAGPGARDAAGFNTTPAMAPCVIGAVARMQAEGEAQETVSRVRDSGAASLAAIGDRLFGGTIRPSASLAGLVALPLGPFTSVVLLLLSQGLPQVAFRLWGLARGLARGKTAIPDCIGMARRVLAVAGPAGAVLAGLFAGAVIEGAKGSYGLSGVLMALSAVPVFGWLVYFRGASPSTLCLTMLALSGLLSIVLGP